MENQIILREYQDSDTPELVNIIREAWNYDKFCCPQIAEKLARIFLYSCLTNQTYTQVALIDKKPVGVIMGKNIQKHRCPLKYRAKQISSILSLYLFKKGREVSKIFQNVSKIDGELLNNTQKKYEGEISFFAVGADYRGYGIGKKLFWKMISIMKKENIRDFYLFTDTSCNYGFYEHQGMVCREEKKRTFTINEQCSHMRFFLYDGNTMDLSSK